MTYKQKLESQINLARQRMQEADDIGRTREVDTWNGYRQGLKYAVAELEGFGYPAEPIVRQTESVVAVRGVNDGKDVFDQSIAENLLVKQCTCDHGDLRPFGECICGAAKVAFV